MKTRIRNCVASILIASALLPAVCLAAQYGNTTAAAARPIMPDGTAYTDQLSQASPNAWFVFRMEPYQSYSIEVWNPFGGQTAIGNLCVADAPFEADGTTVLFFDEAGNLAGSDAFILAAHGSVQVVKPNGVAIGGAVKGGVRIAHDGAPGTIIAHQLLNNPVTNAYVEYPFLPLVHSYGRGGI